MSAFGFIETEKQRPALALQWDQREDYHPADQVDLGWCGENQDGVWLTIHPDAALYQRPHLWPTIAEWRRGHRELTEHDYQTKSAHDHMAKLVMVCANRREEIRRIKAGQNGKA